MDPTVAAGELLQITKLDQLAFDVIGYNLVDSVIGDRVHLGDGLFLSFTDILTPGNTTKSSTDFNQFLNNQRVGLLFDAFDITTTSTFNGSVIIDFEVTQAVLDQLAALGMTSDNLRIFHLVGGTTLEQLTTTLVNIDGTLFLQGQTSSLSPFGFGINPEPTTLFLLGSSLIGLLSKRKGKWTQI